MEGMDKEIDELIEDVREGKLDPDELKTQLDEVTDAAAESAVEAKEIDVTKRARIDRLARKASRL
jgi:hypothetical protein